MVAVPPAMVRRRCSAIAGYGKRSTTRPASGMSITIVSSYRASAPSARRIAMSSVPVPPSSKTGVRRASSISASLERRRSVSTADADASARDSSSAAWAAILRDSNDSRSATERIAPDSRSRSNSSVLKIVSYTDRRFAGSESANRASVSRSSRRMSISTAAPSRGGQIRPDAERRAPVALSPVISTSLTARSSNCTRPLMFSIGYGYSANLPDALVMLRMPSVTVRPGVPSTP